MYYKPFCHYEPSFDALNILVQMAQSRRSSRCNKGQAYDSKLSSFNAIVAYNPLLIEEEAERVFKDVMERMLTDFAKAMREHDMHAEMDQFNKEEFLASAIEEMEIELDRFGCWIESSFINKDSIQKAKAGLDATKRRRKDKVRAVLDLALKLSESLRNAKVDELLRVLEAEVDRYRVREIKNTYQYEKTRSLREKFQREYDDHLLRVEQKYKKTCAEMDIKYARI